MRWYLIDVGDVSPATAPEILPMKYSRDKYLPQLRTKVAEDELEMQLCKKQKKKSQEALDMVLVDKDEEATPIVQE